MLIDLLTIPPWKYGIILEWYCGWWHWPTTMSHVYKETKKILWKRKKKGTCDTVVSQCHQPQSHPSATRKYDTTLVQNTLLIFNKREIS